MRLLTDEEIDRCQDNMDLADILACEHAIAKAQAVETLKEVGDEMMKMSTLQEFHALRVRLIQGKLEEK